MYIKSSSATKGFINNNGVIQRIDDSDDIIIPAPEEMNSDDEDDSDQCIGDHDHSSHELHDHSHPSNSKKKKKDDMKGYVKWDDHFAKERATQSRSGSRLDIRKSVAAKFLDRLSGGSLITDKDSKKSSISKKEGVKKHEGKNGRGSWFGGGSSGGSNGGAVGGNRRGGGKYDDQTLGEEDDRRSSMRGSSSRRKPAFASRDDLRNEKNDAFDEMFHESFNGDKSPGSRDYHDYETHQRTRSSFRNHNDDLHDFDDKYDDKYNDLKFRGRSNRDSSAAAYDEEGSVDGEMESSPVPYRFGRKSRLFRRPRFGDIDGMNLEDGSLIPEESFVNRGYGNRGLASFLSRGRRRSNGFYEDPEMDGFSAQNEDEESMKLNTQLNRARKASRLVERLRLGRKFFRW